MRDKRSPEDDYWGKLKGAKFAEAACKRFQEHMKALEERDAIRRITNAWCQYHSRDQDGKYDNSELAERGEKGVNIRVALNEFRHAVRAKNALMLGRGLQYTAASLNGDSDSYTSTMKAQLFLKHYDARGGLGAARHKLAEEADVMMAAWLGVLWNPYAHPSDEMDLVTNKLAYEGDLTFPVYHTLQVAYDRASKDITDPNWLIVEDRVNRYELAEVVDPKHRDKILDAGCDRRFAPIAELDFLYESDPDYIRVLVVYFKKTVATPIGRHAIVLDEGTVIMDGGMAESRIPLFMMHSSAEIGESGLPYGDGQDILPATLLLQTAHSELASMFAAMMRVIWTPEGADYDLEQLGSFHRIKGGTIKPEVLKMFNLTSEDFGYAAHLLGTIQRLQMMNQATAGHSNAADSGAKLAFQVSTSMQNHQGFLARLTRVMERAASMAIEQTRRRMSDERKIAVVGKDSLAETIKFSKADLSTVHSVLVEEVDPSTETPEFRRAMADQAAQKNWVRSVSEWIAQYKAGTDVINTSDDIARKALLLRENERLVSGEGPIKVCDTDQHIEHIAGHAAKVYDEDVRHDDAALGRIKTHIIEHMSYISPGNTERFFPQLLLALGQTPLPSTDPTGGAMPQEMQPPGAMADSSQKGSPPAEVGQSGRAPSMPEPVGMPGPPAGAPGPSPALDQAPLPTGAER